MAAELVIPTAIRALRSVIKKGIAVVRDRLPQAGHDLASIEPALARNSQRLQQPAARIRQQQQQRSSHASSFSTSFTRSFHSRTAKDAAAAARAPVRTAFSRVTKTTPFASTLRPKLCGALPRSMNGYSLGGNARYFSHTTAPAQVVQQVSAAMRAFLLTSQSAASKRRNPSDTYIRGQIRLHLAAANTDRLAPGAYVDFHLTPRFTALSPADPVGYTTLDDTRGGFLESLSEDFSSAVRDITRTYADLRRLSALGELPVTLVAPATLRVHFRGCDAALVTALCDEVGVTSGIIHEDERFAYDRLFPARDPESAVNWREMMSSSASYTDEDMVDWDAYSRIPSHEVNNKLDALSFSDEGANPHWEQQPRREDDYETFDEIDPGSSDEEVLFGKEECMVDSGGFVNPWVMPTPDRTGLFT
ncbi:hypothetical protein Dda_5973 [Drechslerella dactyloides]|uniref:Uncharacterized protein n=1 Tax=Drechslerella dactyloides TaxID=74499 RepID=A0AAD6NGT3_DREDA|nr:hypothetical protein Dda_5973 [Drechslerella dactyloides]